MATIIQATQINSLNSTVYTYGANTKNTSSLPVSLQSETGNNATAKSTKTNAVTLDNLQSAINILESKFSNNCCQAQCHSTSTTSSCQVCQYCQGCQATSCQSTSCQTYTCQSCQRCQSTSCQSTKVYYDSHYNL